MGSLAASLTALFDLPSSQRRIGPFVLVEQLGRGGFAPVWLAREVYGAAELRTVAVKLFSVEDASRASVIDEARALCRVEHPNVVRFHALPIDEARGLVGLAMEHVAGVSLDRRLDERGRLPARQTLAVGIAIASALAAVHRAGLVHRDVKPANVIEAGGVFKLIDFGIAAADEPRAPRDEPATMPDLADELVRSRASTLLVTASTADVPLGMVCGTIGYIDPACIARGDPATPASDLYALGALLYECLSGRLPAATTDGAGLRGEVLDGRRPAPPLARVAPDVPPALARVVDTLVSARRQDRPRSAEWVAIRLDQIRAELAGAARPLPPESVGPFRGLGRYREDDRDLYFGRAGDVAAVLETLRSRGLSAIVGPSGSGKSSLARAGVLPALAEGALGGWPASWTTVTVEPGSDPRAAIAAALAPIVEKAADLAPEELAAALTERAARTGRGVLILVDQLEELATVSAESSRVWTASLLAEIGEHALPGVRALVTARRDLLDPLLAMDRLGRALIQGSVLLSPIGELTWSAILDRSLSAYGYRLEDEALRTAIMADIARIARAMPLVMFALTELWDRRDTATRTITRRAFEELGGLDGALERHAEATLAELGHDGALTLSATAPSPAAMRAARAVLLSLTTPDGTRATRSAAEIERAAGPMTAEVIAALERARLVVSGAEGVTLVHEALLTQWGRLRAWVDEAREERLFAEEIERDAARFREAPELSPPWRRHRLARALELMRRGRPALSPSAVAFLNAGLHAERRARLAIAGAALGALLAASVAGVAYVRAVQAKEDATRRALVQEQANRAIAEERTREMEEAQRRIERLVRDLAESPSKETVMELERQLRAGKGERGEPPSARAAPATPRAPREAAAAVATAVVPAAATSHAPPSPSPSPRDSAAPQGAPPSPATAVKPIAKPGVGVEKDW